MVLKKIGDFSEYREVTGTPRESYWAYWAIVEERRQATGGGTRPPCPIRIGQGEGVHPDCLTSPSHIYIWGCAPSTPRQLPSRVRRLPPPFTPSVIFS